MYILIFFGVIFFALLAHFTRGRWIARLCFSIFFVGAPITIQGLVLNKDCKREQAEANVSLGTIANSEREYVNEYGIYTDNLEELSFVAKSFVGQLRYNYKVELSSDKKSYKATAQSIVPGFYDNCEVYDVMTINEKLKMERPVNMCDGPCLKWYIKYCFYPLALFFIFCVIYDLGFKASKNLKS